MMPNVLALLLAGSALLLSLVDADAGEPRCFDDWSVAAAVVAREQLVTVEQLQNSRPAGEGAIVRTVLCEEGGHYVYRLLLRDRNGKLTKAMVDARRK